jgi:hypothetical protein
MEFLKVDLMIERIEELKVHTAPPLGAIACQMRVSDQQGEQVLLAWSSQALATLVTALVENSPRVPGTPGRN